jgi:hypothetical protein
MLGSAPTCIELIAQPCHHGEDFGFRVGVAERGTIRGDTTTSIKIETVIVEIDPGDPIGREHVVDAAANRPTTFSI